MAHVRELPPLRLMIDLETPSGHHYMWSDQDPNPENVPSGLRFSDVMPGGFESCDVTLSRKPGVEYPDLERLSTLHVYGAGGEKAWEGRLERVPRTSGSQVAVSPSAVGWQAHLEDDKSAREIYVDRDLSHWRGPSIQRRLTMAGVNFSVNGQWSSSVGNDPGTLRPTIAQTTSALHAGDFAESWYDAHGIIVRYAYRDMIASPPNSGSDASWNTVLHLATGDTAPAVDSAPDTNGAAQSGYFSATTFDRNFALLQTSYTGGFSATGTWGFYWRDVAVYGIPADYLLGNGVVGPHPQGYYASEIVGDIVSRFAPLLKVKSDSIQDSTFVIPHAAWLEPTTVGEIVRDVTKYGLEDWAVWDDKEFVWHPRGARGRKWRARVNPAQLEETGPQVDRLWNSVMVQYQDVSGDTRSVGPPGSGANTIDASLVDTDPENPVNKLGIVRRSLLQMGITTSAGAVEVGRRFLEEQKLLDTSGRAQLVGHVTDDKGVVHPYWKVRAGDTISFVDAAQTGERRIVRTDKDHSTRTCSIDLDAPPEGLQALLERLGVVLVGLGL